MLASDKDGYICKAETENILFHFSKLFEKNEDIVPLSLVETNPLTGQGHENVDPFSSNKIPDYVNPTNLM